MDLDHQRKLTDLAGKAFELEPAQRRAWLEQNCQGDDRLLEEVSALLRLMESSASFSSLETLLPGGAGEAFNGDYWLGKTIGAYRILENLGEGGMGWVFLAEQTEPIERKVALKIIKPMSGSGGRSFALNTVFPPLMPLKVEPRANKFPSELLMHKDAVAERIQAEPQVLAMFTHPYIAQIYEAGHTPEGFVYFAMEYVPGEPLTDYCRAAGLGLEQRLFLFMKVCRGVQHAHHNAVLHLDLKPSNILVRDIDGTASPKVIDFGIAMTTDPRGDSRLQRNLAMGTPVYMCPEALGDQGIKLDARADVYALGVILFELLTGVPAYNPQSQEKGAFAQKVASGTLTKPSDLWRKQKKGALPRQPGLSPLKFLRGLKLDLDWIVLKATAKNRDDRYDGPAELVADLRRYFNCQPVGAAPPSPFYSARKFITRHKWATIGAALFLTVMVAAFWFFGSSYQRAAHALEVSRRTTQFMMAVIDHTSLRPEDRDLGTFLANAERILDFQLGEPSMPRAHYLMLLADIYQKAGQTDRAEDLIDESYRIVKREGSAGNPEMVTILLVRGQVYLAKDRLDAAAADFQRAIVLSEHHLDARKMDSPLYFLARVYDAQGRYDASEEVCRRALNAIGERGFTRNKPRLIRLLAKSLREQGRFEEAAEYEIRLRELPPPRLRLPVLPEE